MRKSYVMMSLLAVVSIGLCGSLARSAPEPSFASLAWELDFDHQTPMMIRVQAPGQADRDTYWYMLYQITNNTGDERYFVPEFTLYTDTGQVIRSGVGVSPAVFEAVRRRHRNDLLESSADLTGRVLQGEDNARFGVAIFRDIDADARKFDIFVGGLSGETVRIELPVPVEIEQMDDEGNIQTVQQDEILLRKTLELHFRLPGEPQARTQTQVIPAGQSWVMR